MHRLNWSCFAKEFPVKQCFIRFWFVTRFEAHVAPATVGHPCNRTFTKYLNESR